MRIFDETKTKEIQENEIDFLKYRLEQSRLFVKHHEAVAEVQEQSHYEIIAEYPNGGKDVKEVVDVAYVAPKEAYDEYEDILYLVPLTNEEIIEQLREQREIECFQIVNRGQLWYNTLTTEQVNELNKWYMAWLDLPNNYNTNKTIPQKPSWLK